MERTGEKRARRKSRKVSETELAVEEPSPPAKRRKKSGGGKTTAGPGPTRPGLETRRGKAAEERARKKRLMVSFDVMEHNLNVGEGGANTGSCTLTVSSADGGGEGGGGGGGRGGGEANGEAMAVKRPSVDIKFKNSKFAFSYLASNKKKTWRSFKQIVTAERSLTWKPDDPTYTSIDAPPPLKPAKKYADISGLTAKYTDPMTGLYFSTSDEFRDLRSLPPNIISGYLALRGKLPIM